MTSMRFATAVRSPALLQSKDHGALEPLRNGVFILGSRELRYETGMARIFFLLSILMALWVLPTYAMPLSEMSQSDLRKAVGAGKSISVKTALKGLSRSVPGKPVDVRAFEGDGVYYRVLLMQSSGVVVSVVLDAETGAVLPTSSEAARSVNASAKSGAGAKATGAAVSANAASQGKANAGNNAGGNGGGNSGGNGGGNSGGNGGGNSGGNGGGNSGGNGGGNSGGNGGGNSGGNGGGNGNSGGNGNGNGKN
jgi:hypothetical protein